MIGFDRIGEKHFTASALIENNSRFLLLFHKKIGLWLYPGGHIETDEEPQDAMFREVREEVGVDVELFDPESGGIIPPLVPGRVFELPVPLAILCERIAARPDSPEHWHIDLVYHCYLADKLRQDMGDREDTKWVTAEEASTLHCPKELPSLMKRAAKRSICSASTRTMDSHL